MAGPRKPDGVESAPPTNMQPGEFRGDPDRGPALSRPVTPAGAIMSIQREGENFAAGLAALEGMEDADKVRLCNLSLKTVRFTKVAGPQQTGKRGMVPVVLQAFEVFETTVEHARRLLMSQEGPGRRPILSIVVVGNLSGNCRGQRTFTAHGRTFTSCPFHDCPHDDHARNPWSVFQAHHYLRMLGTPGAIDRYTTTFDLRRDVTALAMYERRGREEAHREQQQAAVKGQALAESVW